ncbi:hypothetical protein ACFWN7_03380 [Agromyces sp. NPDC058484]|uniref:hypothetical protein n=1 Tax=Agromyces sp. NPDC058484 TaxID=3346524 RepID=UPI003650BAFD
MSSDEAPSWRDPVPMHDLPEQPTEQPDGTDEVLDAGWTDGLADALSDPTAGDPTAANLFTAEIENVDASDWDVDTELIWGEDGGDAIVDGGSLGLDFPL